MCPAAAVCLCGTACVGLASAASWAGSADKQQSVGGRPAVGWRTTMTCAYLMHPHLQVPQAKRAAHKPETVVKVSCSRITKCTACPSVLFGPVRHAQRLRLGWLNIWLHDAGCAPTSMRVLCTHPTACRCLACRAPSHPLRCSACSGAGRCGLPPPTSWHPRTVRPMQR